MEIVLDHVSYTYQAGTPFAGDGLRDVSVTIPDGAYTAIIGQTGSGKSTLLQHLNALLKPTAGTVKIGDRLITAKTSNKNLKPLRAKVGLVFQFAENQLFEETVEKDVAFGPKNFGATEEQALTQAHHALQLVGIDEQYYQQSPFDLSGGQMRRVAIAGVLAMEPELLILDEPTAGLDPKGRAELMGLFATLHREQGIGIVLVTHQMEDVANFAERVLVMAHGQLIKQGTPAEVFADPAWLAAQHLGLPRAAQFARQLQAKGVPLPAVPLTEKALAQELIQVLHPEGGRPS
ncbi:MAG: energy-coupling factor ABC transporter ATP-binding protein [Schleiferilactobacillus harbinensis]|jgi:energy-coupling factor transport system ATP-binding protein|uniref:Energy-coupling factor transporter ATP-binding protein EcfA2 n=2 Tax=Schleiferilactobacillus perolens TaxID=100468 RepID=A0A0R1N0J2_9LACO|nr:energy-coupling factor ABC transporter ATP-binding protein [Schleiferilactobacillus perolens]KRL13289.1 cobalt transporter ATP-binding subunit [Schleiferilactobacillus perolens DSM 12744]MCI1891747.1 energy-coupling factor ABC transporter ATP-binding protein [Schleiferilactobacillus harbinensis]MCI1912650.1 energy-coupling factor ABC transporter ATP-binding protein [Schleiferilactobacillus harbinensis]